MEYSYPLVSIITPSFNQGKYIEETLLSIQNQTYKNIEHIIVDAGSTDQTIAILKKNSSYISWISEPDKGQSDAINKGIRRSHGEILAYLNSDDLYLPYTVSTVVNFFISHPDVDLIYGDIIHVDELSCVTEIIQTGMINPEDFLTCQVYLPQPSVFFRRTVIDKVGCFDESLHLTMDMEYWARALLAVRVMYISKPLAKARFHRETKSSIGYLNNFYEWLYILNKTFLNTELLLSYFKTLDRITEVKKRAYSYVYFFGGLRFLRARRIIQGLHYIGKGLKINSKLLCNPFLYWSIFVFVVGVRFSDNLIQFLPRVKKI